MTYCQGRFFLFKNHARQLLFCLALMALVCRAFIPQGYMPDTQHGKFQLMLCDMGGHAPAMMHHGMDMQHEPSGSSSTHNDIPSLCLFHIAFVHGIFNVSTLSLAAMDMHYFVRRTRQYSVRYVSNTYIPLGARAPPVHQSSH